MDIVQIQDKAFKIYLTENQITERIRLMAREISADIEEGEIIVLGILNGAFMFAADLVRNMNLNCNISFLKLASYIGTQSSGKVKRLIGINEELENKDLLVIEDIVDTGITLDKILKQLQGFEPSSISVATLLFKPGAYKGTYTPDYIGFKIPNEFVVGYGLDYNGLGRNLKHIYKLKE